MRIALIDAARKKYPQSAEARQKALASILRLTLGQTVERFKATYPAFATHQVFSEAVENAVTFRNQLAHHFLEGRLAGMGSEVGVQLIALECLGYSGHFRQIEVFIREQCAADFDGFFRHDVDEANRWVEGHPLMPKLADIHAGRWEA